MWKNYFFYYCCFQKRINLLPRVCLLSTFIIYCSDTFSFDLENGNDLVESKLSYEISSGHRSDYNSLALIRQIGEHNLASINQQSHSSEAQISQLGSDNIAKITQYGADNEAQIYQKGNHNYADVLQEGVGNNANIKQFGHRQISLEQISDFQTINIVQH